MARGVEARVPLLDPDLVYLAASLPDNYRQRGMEGKWIFKKAMEGILPKEVIYRPKTGFGAPLRYWLRTHLRDLLEDALSPARLKERGIFDVAAVYRLKQANDSGWIDASYTLFALLCIEIWCRIFIDGKQPDVRAVH